jgi:hypothetical protein
MFVLSRESCAVRPLNVEDADTADRGVLPGRNGIEPDEERPCCNVSTPLALTYGIAIAHSPRAAITPGGAKRAKDTRQRS